MIVIPVVLLVAIGIWQLVIRYEGNAPEVLLTEFPTAVSTEQEISIGVSDQGSGLRKIWVGILQNGTETVLLEKDFPRKNIFSKGDVREDPVEIIIEPKEIGVTDGEAELRISVWDCSWRDGWNGNNSYIKKTLLVDTKPAQIEVLSDAHNITQGGAGLIIYRLSEACLESGTMVGDNFFPGYAGYFQDPLIYISLFALGYDQGADTNLAVTATDVAGNQSKAGFYHHIQKKNFKSDTIRITDSFLDRKIPEFEAYIEGTEGMTAVEKFLKVNRELRADNYETVVRITQQSDPEIYWQGVFGRLPGAANRATFAEARDYLYDGEKIDRQTHLGIDLASVANAQVPAANAGRVSFAGLIGIYGNTVVIDHGFGLFTLYSHLSSISVQEGQMLQKGDVIGRTGATGMAGGDHLHFSVLVHNTFVNPLEWWDASWIENNITSKLTGVASATP